MHAHTSARMCMMHTHIHTYVSAYARVHAQAKAEKLIKALGNERNNRIQKEKLFVELLQEERTARLQVFALVYVCCVYV